MKRVSVSEGWRCVSSAHFERGEMRLGSSSSWGSGTLSARSESEVRGQDTGLVRCQVSWGSGTLSARSEVRGQVRGQVSWGSGTLSARSEGREQGRVQVTGQMGQCYDVRLI